MQIKQNINKYIEKSWKMYWHTKKPVMLVYSIDSFSLFLQTTYNLLTIYTCKSYITITRTWNNKIINNIVCIYVMPLVDQLCQDCMDQAHKKMLQKQM